MGEKEEEIQEIHDLPEFSWEERSLHLLETSKLDEGLSAFSLSFFPFLYTRLRFNTSLRFFRLCQDQTPKKGREEAQSTMYEPTNGGPGSHYRASGPSRTRIGSQMSQCFPPRGLFPILCLLFSHHFLENFSFFFLSVIHIYFLSFVPFCFLLIIRWYRDVGFHYCSWFFEFDVFFFSQQIGFSIDRKGSKILKITIGLATCFCIPAVQWHSCHRL